MFQTVSGSNTGILESFHPAFACHALRFETNRASAQTVSTGRPPAARNTDAMAAGMETTGGVVLWAVFIDRGYLAFDSGLLPAQPVLILHMVIICNLPPEIQAQLSRLMSHLESLKIYSCRTSGKNLAENHQAPSRTRGHESRTLCQPHHKSKQPRYKSGS